MNTEIDAPYDLRCGLVRPTLTWTSLDGRATDLVYEVLVDQSGCYWSKMIAYRAAIGPTNRGGTAPGRVAPVRSLMARSASLRAYWAAL